MKRPNINATPGNPGKQYETVRRVDFAYVELASSRCFSMLTRSASNRASAHASANASALASAIVLVRATDSTDFHAL